MKNVIFDLKKYAATARQAAAEGIVLLKNDDALPLKKGSEIALFGRTQYNYYKSGTGSGGLVNTGYIMGFAETLESGGFILNRTVKSHYESLLDKYPFDSGIGWAAEPWYQAEIPIDNGLCGKASAECETAVIIIGRTAGEDKDNKAEKGSYLLTEDEEKMLKEVCVAFKKTVVLLNTGNIIDMTWLEKYKPSAVMYIWQGGQEGANAAFEVLCGRINPSGRLTDTIAQNISDYPSTENHGGKEQNIYKEDIYVGYRYFETFAKERVLFPFGFGLSYTEFRTETERLEFNDDTVIIRVAVTNIGNTPGKNSILAYCKAPIGKLGKPERVLIGFSKTRELEPGEKQTITIKADYKTFSSYDDLGKTGYKSAWVLEEGSYDFYIGGDVRGAEYCGNLTIDKLKIVEQTSEAMAPINSFQRMTRDGYENVPKRTISPETRRFNSLPAETDYKGDLGYKLIDVQRGKITLSDFISQLSDEDLFALVRGEGMCSPKVTAGTAGAFGGVTERLTAFGIPVACCADGPSGIRMDCGTIAFSLPNGTCIGCSFNEELAQELFEFEGLELRKNKIDTLLGPGINIHRNPLNGRNFEYFSEDPLLSGKMAAAQLKGLHKYGVTGTTKHFACNSQEENRTEVEAVVSERALREVYLRPFEICVKEGGCRSVMTSYNPINGFWSASNYELLTSVLRDCWGYNGIVMTDWWAKGNDEGEPASPKNVASMVRAQNDLFMVVNNAGENSGGDNSAEALKAGKVTRGEYQRSALNICNFLMETPAFKRLIGISEEIELEKNLADLSETQADEISESFTVNVENEASIQMDMVNTARGKSVLITTVLSAPGHYAIKITCRAAQGNNPLAQIPLSIFHNSVLLNTLSLTGADNEWRIYPIPIDFPMLNCTAHFKLTFGQSGMEIKEFMIYKTGEKDS